MITRNNFIGLGLLLVLIGIAMVIFTIPYAGVVVFLGVIAFIVGLFIGAGARL